MLDGLGKVRDYVARAEKLKMAHLGLTDHGTISGAWEHYTTCRKTGINPVLGAEFYFHPTATQAKELKDRDRYHVTILARNRAGFKTLTELVTEAHRRFYTKPLLERSLLESLGDEADNLVCLSGCAGSIISKEAMKSVEEGLDEAKWWKSIFRNFFIEIMAHGSTNETKLNNRLLKIGRRLDIEPVITNDPHYVHKEEHAHHDALLAIQVAADIDDPTRFHFDGRGFHLRSRQELDRAFRKYRASVVATGLDNTLQIAEMCRIDIPEWNNKSWHIPRYPKLPEKYNGDSNRYLRRLTIRRLKERGLDSDNRYTARANHELEAFAKIDKMADFLLITYEALRWARKRNIEIGPGRGCLDGNARIWTTKGFIPISKVVPGDRVLTSDGIRKVQKRLKYFANEELISFRCYYDSDQPVWFTKDHKILVERGKEIANLSKRARGYRWEPPANKPQWIAAGTIQRGDLVVIPQTQQPKRTPEKIDLAEFAKATESQRTEIIIGKKSIAEVTRFNGRSKETSVIIPRFISIDENFCKLLGMLVSNGWLNKRDKRHIGWAERASTQTPELINTIAAVWPGNLIISRVHTDKDVVQHVIRSNTIRNLYQWLMPGYKMNALTKTIRRKWLMGLSESNRMSVIKGLWWGDGSVTDRNSYTTSSPRLAFIVRTLLWSVGLPAGIQTDHRTDNRKEWKNRHISWKITTSRGFLPPKSQFGASFEDNIYLRVFDVRTKKKQPSKVYDLQIKGVHNYLTDSFLVHNSITGSLVAYLLNIHELDSVRYNLLFERFLNPERPKAPDVDSDFEPDGRPLVIQHYSDLYGAENVMRVAAFQTMKIASVFQTLARAHGISPQDRNRLTKELGQFSTDDEDDDQEDDIDVLPEEIRETYPDMAVQMRHLLGTKRAISRHAAGVIIFDPQDSIKDLVGLQWLINKSAPGGGNWASQFDLKTVSGMNLMKQDTLGLRTLATIKECVRLVKENHGIELDYHSWVPDEEPDDDKIYAMLAEGNTAGIFQAEGNSNGRGLREVKPTCFEDLSTITALYRKGPIDAGSDKRFLKNRNDNKARVIHPALKPILDLTWGEMIYDEQMLQILNEVAGLSWARVDDVKNAMKLKDPKMMAEIMPDVIKGFISHSGMKRKQAEQAASMIEAQSSYLFSRNHAIAYSLSTYRTARLKYLYPLEYMTALVRTVKPSSPKQKIRRMNYVAEISESFKVLPPDINQSEAKATCGWIDGKGWFRFGLTDCSGIGDSKAEKLLSARQAEPIGFFGVDDVEEATDKGTFKVLARVGALESVGGPVTSLRLKQEIIGYRFSDPMKKLRKRLIKKMVLPEKDKDYVRIYGEIISVEHRETRNGKSFTSWIVQWSPTTSWKVQLWDDRDGIKAIRKGTIVKIEGEYSSEWDNISVNDPEQITIIKES